MQNPGDQHASQLREWITTSSRAVFFTGAGISTESGIPDFRSPGGFWTKYPPIHFSDFIASEEMRREAWRRRLALEESLHGVAPNRGHRAIARWVGEGSVAAVITQNIDGLHQASGVPDEKVIELHGNGGYAQCLDCERRYELQGILRAFRHDETLPICPCGGIIKTATVSFGQAMPRAAMERAGLATEACDLFVAVGSSLVVHPAAGFPARAKRLGARLVILNREPTPLDGLADLVIRAEIGQTLAAAAGLGNGDGDP